MITIYPWCITHDVIDCCVLAGNIDIWNYLVVILFICPNTTQGCNKGILNSLSALLFHVIRMIFLSNCYCVIITVTITVKQLEFILCIEILICHLYCCIITAYCVIILFKVFRGFVGLNFEMNALGIYQISNHESLYFMSEFQRKKSAHRLPFKFLVVVNVAVITSIIAHSCQWAIMGDQEG